LAGKQDREFRPGQADARGLALRDRLVIGQEFNRAVQVAGLFQGPHVARHAVQQVCSQRARHRDGLGLQIVVAQDQLGHLVGHPHQQVVALLARERAAGFDVAEQNLDVDFMVRAVDTGRVVDRIGVEPAAEQGVFDSGPLGHAQIGALADHPAP